MTLVVIGQHQLFTTSWLACWHMRPHRSPVAGSHPLHHWCNHLSFSFLPPFVPQRRDLFIEYCYRATENIRLQHRSLSMIQVDSHKISCWSLAVKRSKDLLSSIWASILALCHLCQSSFSDIIFATGKPRFGYGLDGHCICFRCAAQQALSTALPNNGHSSDFAGCNHCAPR